MIDDSSFWTLRGKGAGSRVRCTGEGCGTSHSLQRCRNHGAGHPMPCKGAGWGDQVFSLMSFTGRPPQLSPQPFASGLQSVWQEE